MDRGSIVLKSISCRGVQSFNLFQKPSTYAVVSIAAGNDGRRKQKRKQKTSADHEGGENPEWDQTIQFDFDDSDFKDLFLEFAIMAQGNLLLFGDKLVGKSRVPITDLSVGHPSDAFRHVSYQVRSPEGKPNGVLSFSYSLNLPEMEIRLPPPLDHGIPSAPPTVDYTPPPAQPTKSLYPPIPLPEAEPEDCFCHYNQPPPPDPPKYYYPLPPPPPASGYYPAFDRAVSSPVLSRDAYLSVPVTANAGYYSPPTASIPPPMPAFGTYHPSSGPSYTYPPSQDFCSYCNCK
ncbi:hypothetical protein KFK09_025689 [Dendrobium nobile]|uniref:C2 domain-containing protein n=1 Tax=Dendrobium nobile TaxID=94219 RepID=A0A8T3A5V5_DENNO|nr:hypothetical protein KFK09_025689 [Dendrobium nobile]